MCDMCGLCHKVCVEVRGQVYGVLFPSIFPWALGIEHRSLCFHNKSHLTSPSLSFSDCVYFILFWLAQNAWRKTRLASDLRWPSCFSLLSCEITGIHHHEVIDLHNIRHFEQNQLWDIINNKASCAHSHHQTQSNSKEIIFHPCPPTTPKS